MRLRIDAQIRAEISARHYNRTETVTTYFTVATAN